MLETRVGETGCGHLLSEAAGGKPPVASCFTSELADLAVRQASCHRGEEVTAMALAFPEQSSLRHQ